MGAPQQIDAANSRWVTSAVLVALAARLVHKGGTFTSADLRAWVPGIKVQAQCKSAAATLQRCGFVTSEMRLDKHGKSYARYTVTAEGEAAIKAVAGGQRHASGPKGPHQANRTVGSQTFAARLWALLRARGMLDGETAAATLVDAGQDVATAASTARRYLARWASTGAVMASRKREANGCKRFVLVNDCGPTPPAWTPKARARAGAMPTEPTTTTALGGA